MNDYYKFIMGGLFALNLFQMRQVHLLLEAGKEVRDQRDNLLLSVYELVEIRDTLIRVINENDVELTDFDRVLLESNVANLNSFLERYN